MLGSTLCLIFSCDIDVHLSIILRSKCRVRSAPDQRGERGRERMRERERGLIKMEKYRKF